MRDFRDGGFDHWPLPIEAATIAAMSDARPNPARDDEIELVPPVDLRPPRLPGSFVVRESSDVLIDALAAELLLQAKACVRTFGDFHLALSAFPAAEPVYLRLMYDPTLRDLPWKRTHLWIVEETADGPTDTACAGDRFPQIADILVGHSDIPSEQVHALAVGESAAVAYERELQEHLAWREKGQDRLDYALLPLLEDGFTQGMSDSRDRLVRSSPTGPRTGMTARLLNASRLLAVMAVGTRAASAVRALESGPRHTPPEGDRLHLTQLRPVGGELRWYLDAAAVARS